LGYLSPAAYEQKYFKEQRAAKKFGVRYLRPTPYGPMAISSEQGCLKRSQQYGQ